jgi:HEAT repeat protein
MNNNQNEDVSTLNKATMKNDLKKSPEIINSFKEALKDESALTRVTAYKNLINIGKPAIPALLTALDSVPADCYIQDALKTLGRPAAESLIQALKNEKLSKNVKIALAGLDEDAIRPLVRALKDPLLIEDISDIFCSLHIRGILVVQSLIEAISSKQLRQGAIHVLTDIILIEVLGKRDYILLIKILSERSTRKVFSKHFLNVPQLIPDLIEIAGELPSISIVTGRIMAKSIATTILIEMGEPAVDHLISSLSSAYNRVTSRKILTRIGSLALPALLAVANSESEIEIRCLIITILGDIGDRDAVPPLVSLLKQDVNSVIQIECVKSLGKIDDPAVLRELLVALEYKGIESNVAEVISKSPKIKKSLKSFNKINRKCFCSQCLHRVKAKRSAYKENHFILSYICRNCLSISQVVDEINRVVLVVDSDLPAAPPDNNLLYYKEIDNKLRKSTLYINWVWHKDPFDFDEIQIKTTSQFDIEEFIMKIRNDADNERRKRRFRNIPLIIFPNQTFSNAQLNALKDTFRKIQFRSGQE